MLEQFIEKWNRIEPEQEVQKMDIAKFTEKWNRIEPEKEVQKMDIEILKFHLTPLIKDVEVY
jgi:FMN-dependent NADH-azoreductase